MTALAITRWILMRILRSPLGWGLLVLSALAWPALARFTPVGITTSSRDSAALVYEVAFLALLLGATLGLRALESIQPVLLRAPSGARWRAEAAASWVSSLIWALVATAWPLAFGGVGEGRVIEFLWLLGLAAAQLSALCLLLLRTRLPEGTRSLGLLILAWWVPSLLGTSSLLERWTSALLDVSATVRPPLEGWSPTALAARIGPMMGLASAALLIARRREHGPLPRR